MPCGQMGRSVEIWISVNDKWQLAAAFAELDLASAMAKNYTGNMRLIHAVYEGDLAVHKDVLVELGAISYIRHHYMETPMTSAVFQVVVGGVLVFLTGILIGSF